MYTDEHLIHCIFLHLYTMNKMLIKLSEKKLVNTKSAFLFGEVKVAEEIKKHYEKNK